jgi:hypothetical protein
MVRSWVAVYTLGLPRELRSSRRWEIDSDVWEQRQLAEMHAEPPFGTAVEMVARTLFGVISDITWRVQTGMSMRPDRSTKVNESLTMRGFFLAAVAIAIAPAAFGVSIFAGGGEGFSGADRAIFGSLQVAAAAAMVAGLVLSTRQPLLGIGLVALGAICMAVLWYWVPFITVPLGAALVFLAYRRARQTGWPGGAGTA